MRVTTGLVAVVGFGMSVTVALGQAPERGARLLPPQPLVLAEAPTVARGAAESLPGVPDSTPVPRSGSAAGGVRPASGPAWINGTGMPDAGVRPASGTTGNASLVRPLTPKEDLSGGRGSDKLKTPLGAPGAERRNTASASTPFQGTAGNGQLVYAGPPAYRWYGWGSVTPGANPSAPTGRYAAASANWYSITGATPGAFPVPVTNSARPTPGTEPPAYGANPSVAHPVMTYPQVQPTPAQQSISHQAAPAETPVLPPATVIPPEAQTKPVAVPTITSPPASAAPVAPPAAPVTEPVVVPAPPVAPVSPPVTHSGEPAATPLPEVKPPASPSPLPASVRDEPNWQPGGARPSGGDWGPTGGSPGRPQSRGNEVRREPVARGQVGEAQTDSVANLIRGECARRATGVEVRWTGTRKLSVAFACGTSGEAERLVKDISARPELTPYQIDFRVVVK